MNNLRTVRKIIKGRNAIDGAGVKLVRVFDANDVKDFDPFLMLDAFDSTNPNDYIKGFPWHPHRGIETITYLIQGNIEHSDSLGNKGNILDGDCQWMTAGSGIIHQEMPKHSEKMIGAQIWLNLPAKNKMIAPKYGDIKKENIPIVIENDNKVHIIAGTYKGLQGAFQGDYIKATYLDVEVLGEKEWFFENDKDLTLFIYIVEGEGYFFETENKKLISEKNAVLFGAGEKFWVKASDKGIRFLLLSGKSLKESIAWGGPIVMNTKEELELAFEELEKNTFIK